MSTSDTNNPNSDGPQNGAPENSAVEHGNALAAAEYALGLLDGDELAAAKARMGDDDGFAWRKVWWDNWFAPLTDNMQGAEPDPAVWNRIAAQMDIDSDTARSFSSSPLGSAAGAQIIDLNVAIAARLKRWQWTAGITSAAAAVLAAVMIFGSGSGAVQVQEPVIAAAAPAPLVGQVPIGDTGLRLDVTYVPESERLLIKAIGLAADGVHDHELWLVPADGGALQSLGVVKPGGVLMHDLAGDVAANIGDGVQMVLTREPIGGKPNGADAGPVVAQGAFSEV